MFSERLKASRKEAGLTQVELAKVLKVSKGTVGMWEIGKREPKLEMMKHLSKNLNKSVDYLLGLSENRHPKVEEISSPIKNDWPRIEAQVIHSCEDYDIVLIKKHQ